MAAGLVCTASWVVRCQDEVYVMNRIAKVGGDNGDGGAINEAELENAGATGSGRLGVAGA